MREIVGTNNRVLEISLSNKEVKEFFITENDRRMFLGGKGMGLKLLYDRLRPGINPLGEDNILVFMMGTLLGTGAPCSSRFAGLTKSPLTGLVVSSSCGGPFGMAFKTAGYDGLLITGRSDSPVYLTIDDNSVEFKDAHHLWGMDTWEAQHALCLGKKGGALVIGRAGEHKVLYANIASGYRFLGRGGMGAVMGAKNLKAVVAFGGDCRILPKNPKKFERIRDAFG